MRQQPQITIQNIIKRISEPDFTFSKLDPEYFAPLNGAAYAVAVTRKGNREEPRLKITQLRKIFAEVKRLEANVKGKNKTDPLDREFNAQLYLLQPQLAYARGRELMDKDFFDLMTMSLTPQKLKTVGDFLRFSEFLTAVLAYSKYVGK